MMTKLQLRRTELSAEMAICRMAIRIQMMADQIRRTDSIDKRKAVADLLISVISGASMTLAIEKPVTQDPEGWREWVDAWNRLMAKTGKYIYTIYVGNN